jgi:carbon storage regulator
LLIFIRRVGERLTIGDHITVSVEQVQGFNVRVGIAAPRQIAVHRREVFEQIQGETSGSRSAKTRESLRRPSASPFSSVKKRRRMAVLKGRVQMT